MLSNESYNILGKIAKSGIKFNNAYWNECFMNEQYQHVQNY